MGEAGSEREATDAEIEEMRADRRRGDGGRRGRVQLVARADPTRRRRPAGAEPVRVAERARGACAARRASTRRVDQLSAPQLDRRARRRGQRAARSSSAVASRCRSSSRASVGVRRSTCRARTGSRSSSGSRTSGREGVGIYSLLRNHPFDRDFDFVRGTNLYEGVPSWHQVAKAGTVGGGEARVAPRPGLRDEMRTRRREPQQGRREGLDVAAARMEGGRTSTRWPSRSTTSS